MEQKPRVLVAMSGGVDSSVAAWRLIEAGFDCVGATMILHDNTSDKDRAVSPASEPAPAGEPSDVAAARAVAERLGIPFHVLDCRAAFEQAVVEEFVAAYERGVTPNPCCICNRHIKFGLLWDRARELGCDLMATGHYARIVRRPLADGRTVPALAKARDLSKDQSYFLYGIGHEALEHTLFPLGDLTKEGDVRRIAREQGFANAEKRDSQGICFVPGNDFATFIERRRGRALPEGEVLDTAGHVLGRHRGAIRYTVGQRKGLGIAAERPLYVTAIDAVANTVTLGNEENLMAGSLVAGDWVWTAPADEMEAALDSAGPEGLAVGAKIRYRQEDQAARLMRDEAGRMRIDFEAPQRGIAPGQAVVIYRGDIVLGGGTVLR